MAKTKEIKFHGYATKMKLVSNNQCYGPTPRCGEEIEQRLTVSRDGHIWFSGYGYDESGKLVKLRQFQEKISPERANLFLASIGYEMTQREELRCTDVGTWKLELTNDMGEVFTSCGSLVPNEKQLQILSDEFRQMMKWNSFYVFDGKARFLVNRKPGEKIFVLMKSIVSLGSEGTWYFIEDEDICLGDQFHAPIRHGDSSFMGEVIDIVVASPEKGPVSLKKQEKMMTLTQRIEIPDVFTDFFRQRKNICDL